MDNQEIQMLDTHVSIAIGNVFSIYTTLKNKLLDEYVALKNENTALKIKIAELESGKPDISSIKG